LQNRDHIVDSGETKLEDELVSSLARQGGRVTLPIMLSATLIASFVWDQLPFYSWGGWVLFVTALSLLRWGVVEKLNKNPAVSSTQKLHVLLLFSILNGSAHAAALFFFPYIGDYERAILSMVLIGLCAGSIGANVGYMPVFLGYLLPILVSLSLTWATLPSSDDSHTTSFVAILIAVLGVLLILLAKDAFKLFRESFDMRSQQSKLNQELQAALEKAESASLAKTRFLAAASHDLRQPIHTLSLLGAALNQQELNANSREIAAHMNSALQTLASQLDDLLDISKLDAGVVKVIQHQIDLDKMLSRICNDYKTVATEKELVLTYKGLSQSYTETDETQLERVVRNLISNAIKYTNKGTILLTLTAEGERYQLSIKDTGIGIALEDQNKIFEEFYQVGNSQRDRRKGLGLGLAIVQRSLNMLNIPLNLKSTPNTGSEFSLTFQKSINETLPIPVVNLRTGTIDNKHILVIDDEIDVSRSMKILLEGLGSSVDVADCTQAAIEAVKIRKPDVVLSDLRLTENDNGIAALNEIRKIYPDMPALLITGESEPESLQKVEKSGFKMLHKPVSVEILKSKILEVSQENPHLNN